jgi:hypothetical protein
MRHGLIAGIAAIAFALALGALLANWERGPNTREAAVPETAVQDGRAATATDPALPMAPTGNSLP